MAHRTPRSIALEKGIDPKLLADPPKIEGDLPPGKYVSDVRPNGTPPPNCQPMKKKGV